MKTLKMETSIKGNNGTAKGTFWTFRIGALATTTSPLMQLQNWTLYSYLYWLFWVMCAIGSCFFICIYPISLFQMQHCRTESFQVDQTVSWHGRLSAWTWKEWNASHDVVWFFLEVYIVYRFLCANMTSSFQYSRMWRGWGPNVLCKWEHHKVQKKEGTIIDKSMTWGNQCTCVSYQSYSTLSIVWECQACGSRLR
jgi:hypothetical protein